MPLDVFFNEKQNFVIIFDKSSGLSEVTKTGLTEEKHKPLASELTN